MANSLASRLCNNRTCLRIRRNESLQRAARRLEKAPNGIMAPLPAFFGLLSWILSICSTSFCGFLARKVSLIQELDRPLEGTAGDLLVNQGVGFWGFNAGGTCYSYKIGEERPEFDASFSAASFFTTFTDAVGGIVVVSLMLGTVFPILPLQYTILGSMTVMVGILDMCTLSMFGSMVCKADFFNYATAFADFEFQDFTEVSCGLGSGSVLAIFSSLFWLATAACIFLTNLVDKDRVPHAYRGSQSDDAHLATHESDDDLDEAHQLYAKRRQETEQKYREMFGDDDDDDVDLVNKGNPTNNGEGEEQPLFESSVAQKLSLVPEGSTEDDDVGHSSIDDDDNINDKKDDDNNADQFRDEYDDDEDEYDNVGSVGGGSRFDNKDIAGVDEEQGNLHQEKFQAQDDDEDEDDEEDEDENYEQKFAENYQDNYVENYDEEYGDEEEEERSRYSDDFDDREISARSNEGNNPFDDDSDGDDSRGSRSYQSHDDNKNDEMKPLANNPFV